MRDVRPRRADARDPHRPGSRGVRDRRRRVRRPLTSPPLQARWFGWNVCRCVRHGSVREAVAISLQREQVAVQAVGTHQFVVSSQLDDVTLVEDEDDVGCPHRREAVRNEITMRSSHSVWRRSKRSASARGSRRRRLVHDDDRGVVEEGPGDGEALPLPDGMSVPPVKTLPSRASRPSVREATRSSTPTTWRSGSSVPHRRGRRRRPIRWPGGW